MTGQELHEIWILVSISIEVLNFVSKFDINGLIDCNTTSNHEINNFHNKKPLSIIDMLGRNTKVLKIWEFSISMMMAQLRKK